jgi:hypothetical protein
MGSPVASKIADGLLKGIAADSMPFLAANLLGPGGGGLTDEVLS